MTAFRLRRPVGEWEHGWSLSVRVQENDIIKLRSRLGDLLIRANLVSVEQVSAALVLQAEKGGRLGDNLVATSALSQSELDDFLQRTPAEPMDLEATGIDPDELLSLLMKLVHNGRLASVRQFVDAIKLPRHVVLALVRMAVDRKLIFTLGLRNSDSALDMKYAFTDEGLRWTVDAFQRTRYAGPAPVSLEAFTEQVNRQKFTNELVTIERIRECLSDLSFEESIHEQSGPALSSGRAILLYGPPGNGKTSLALRLANMFTDIIYVPYAVMVNGQIIIVHDPRIHSSPEPASVRDENAPVQPFEEYDTRWVPCKRPVVATGGELTLDMLDLRYDELSRFYEAPLHMKVLGGCFVIDDFGRQSVSPNQLLNRLMVPLENRIDHMKLDTGSSFSIPFQELVIFSTNLDPEDLIETAFLRRLPYKIEIVPPTLDIYKRIFAKECELRGLQMDDEPFDLVVRMIRDEAGLNLAAFQPKFIIDQVFAICRFMGQAPRFDAHSLSYAIHNLDIKRRSPRALPALS